VSRLVYVRLSLAAQPHSSLHKRAVQNSLHGAPHVPVPRLTSTSCCRRQCLKFSTVFQEFFFQKSSGQNLPWGPLREDCDALLSFFLSWVLKTQPNHWTKRMASTRLATFVRSFSHFLFLRHRTTPIFLFYFVLNFIYG